jgi:hypothetical protein
MNIGRQVREVTFEPIEVEPEIVPVVEPIVPAEPVEAPEKEPVGV